MVSTKKSFAGFDGAYSHSAYFPQVALEEIPPSLITAIDKGSTTFFEDLKESFPNLYLVLTRECDRLYLLESISRGMGLDNMGKEYRTYCWGLKCKNTTITIGIPTLEPTDPIKLKRDQKYLSCLPLGFEFFYRKMDGMAVVEDVGLHGFDLPTSYKHWQHLTNYADDLGIPVKSLGKLLQNDIRVFIRGSQGDLILLNFTTKNGSLIYVKNRDFGKYLEVPNPRETLDHYFAKAVKGIPGNMVPES